MIAEDITFEQAYARLQEIHTLVSTPEHINIDAMMGLQTEAKELHDFLQWQLLRVKADLAEPTNT
jgi:hypothetical protein